MRLAVDNSTPATVAADRRAAEVRVHVARKAVGMEEEDYRELMHRLTGRRSLKELDGRQIAQLMAEFARMGFTGGPRPACRMAASSPTARMARALWISLYQLGAIEDASEWALEAFARRQLNVDRLQWADERQGYKLLEALKAMAQRHGWDQRVPARIRGRERVRLLKDRLVGAQLARLAAAGAKVTGPIAASREDWSEKQLQDAAAELGVRVRFAIPKPT